MRLPDANLTTCVVSTVLAISSVLHAATVRAQVDEVAPLVEAVLSKPEPEHFTVLLPELNDDLRTAVSFELLNRRERIRDAVLTLVTMPGRNGYESEVEEVFESLGPQSKKAIAPILVAWLQGDEPARQSQADQALYYFDGLPISIIDQLREMTRSKTPATRLRACKLLARFGPAATEALPYVQACLQDKNGRVQLLAAIAIGAIDPENVDCVDVLFAIARSDDHGLARDALFALQKLGPRVLQHPERLKQSLESPLLHQDAGWVIASLGPKVLPLLVHWLNDDATSIRARMEICRAISQMEGDVASARESLLLVVDSYSPANHKLVLRALQALDCVGGFDATRLEPLLGEDSEVRLATARALSSCSRSSAQQAASALRSLMRDEIRTIRIAACQGLCELKVVDDGVVEFILNVLKTGNPREKATAMSMLERVAIPSTIPALMRMFESDDVLSAGFGSHQICMNAVPPLVAIGKPAVPALLIGLQHDDPDVRALSARTLGQIGDPRAIKPLQKLLTDREPRPVVSGCFSTNQEVRVEVIHAIAELGEHASDLVPQLIALVKEDWSRTAATKALGQIGPAAERAIPVLLRSQSPDWSDPAGFEIARAINRMRPTGSISLLGIRRVLKSTCEESSYSTFNHFGLAETIDLIVELGDKAGPLIPELAFMVEDHELLHREHRIHAAYALAKIDGSNPKWKRLVERWATEDSSAILNPAVDRLQQLAN